MTLIKSLPAAVLSLAIASPVLALSAIPDVPSLWPAEGAFEVSGVTAVIATKDMVAAPVAPADDTKDR